MVTTSIVVYFRLYCRNSTWLNDELKTLYIHRDWNVCVFYSAHMYTVKRIGELFLVYIGRIGWEKQLNNCSYLVRDVLENTFIRIVSRDEYFF
jgi:hypothetical protein